jgi:integrase
MARALTAIAIANLKPRPQRFEVADPGCAGLRVVVFPSRKKSFIVRFRYRGAQRKLTLGPVLGGGGEPTDAPELGTPLSLSAARELATKALRQAKSGSDPCEAKRQKREEELAAESDTLAAVAAEYLRREGPRLRTISQRESDLGLICDKAMGLGRLPIASIRRGQFTRAFDRVADERGPVRADRVLSATRTLLGWHAGRGECINVLAGARRRISISERARSRILSDAELTAVWVAAEQDKSPFGRFVQFALLTATRRGEAAGLRRSELSDGGAVWTIPSIRYKSNRDVVIPLSTAAMEIIAAMPVRGDYVFSFDGSHPLGDFANRKQKLDEVCGVTGWTIHDLRRTSRTLLSRAGISADIAEMCLGHTIGGIRGVYDRFKYADEKAKAFESLASLIQRIVNPASDVVVPIIRKRR